MGAEDLVKSMKGSIYDPDFHECKFTEEDSGTFTLNHIIQDNRVFFLERVEHTLGLDLPQECIGCGNEKVCEEGVFNNYIKKLNTPGTKERNDLVNTGLVEKNEKIIVNKRL